MNLKETGMEDFSFEGVGQVVSFSKTVSESDIYLFADITGDFSPNHVNPNHVNEEFMGGTQHGRRIAHGATGGLYVNGFDTRR